MKAGLRNLFFLQCWIICAASAFAQDPGVVPSNDGPSLGFFLFPWKVPEPKQPFELNKPEADYIDKLLDHWQSSSEKVQNYSCQFKRYDFDSEAVSYRDPKDNRLAAATLAIGRFRYKRPGRALYETEHHWEFRAPPKEVGGQPEYSSLVSKENDAFAGDTWKEKWLCDGDKVFEFDFANRIVYEDELPDEMKGTEMLQKVFPLLVGAPKDEILNRFWVRPIAQGDQDEFWLEVYPKRTEDARFYSKIELVLAKEDLLPKAIHIYARNYDAKKGNFQSRYFMLENREVNRAVPEDVPVCVFPRTLNGWKRINRTALYKEPTDAPDQTNGQSK